MPVDAGGGPHPLPLDSPTRTRVVVSFPLPREALHALRDGLGDGFVVDDIRTADDGADVVLSPSCSPGAIVLLRRQFPGARVCVVELEDLLFKVKLTGPVTRVLDAGADAYLIASSTADLAEQLRPTGTATAAAAPEQEPAAIDAATADVTLEQLAQLRQTQPRTARPPSAPAPPAT